MKTHMLSLGLATDMIFHRFDGVVIERGEYRVVKTPSNPNFFYGNFLHFPLAPRPGSLACWRELFRKEFSDSPEVRHLTFVWDGGPGFADELRAADFTVDFTVVLTARGVHPPKKFNSDVTVRPITTDAEWRAVMENQNRAVPAGHDPGAHRLFKEQQFARYQLMSERRLGHWFGAFLGEKLVGDLGIFREGELGRFQQVETHPDHLRQGVCGTLVYETARFALEKMGAKQLVMVADESYHAAKIYESVGFAPHAKEYSAHWWPKHG